MIWSSTFGSHLDEVLDVIVSAFRSLQRALRPMGLILTRDVVMLGRKRNLDVEQDFETHDFVRISSLELLAAELNARNAGGDCAEVGVYKGDFASVINRYFPTRKLYLFDTFKGFDDRDLSADKARDFVSIEADFSDTSVATVMKKMTHPANCIVKPGYFPETARDVTGSFCFVSLDTDLYQPTIEGLRFFYPRLVPGGAIFVHDYNNVNYLGIREAVTEFCNEAGVAFLPMSDRCGSAVFQASRNSNRSNGSIR